MWCLIKIQDKNSFRGEKKTQLANKLSVITQNHVEEKKMVDETNICCLTYIVYSSAPIVILAGI